MGTKRRILFLALVLCVLGLLGALAWVVFRPREPRYEGRPLSQWLEALSPLPMATGPVKPANAGPNLSMVNSIRSAVGPPSAEALAMTAADKALHHFGSNAIPFLVRMLRAKDSALKLKLVELAQRQQLVKINFEPASRRNMLACEALGRLGPEAASAVSALVGVYDRSLASMQSRTVGHDYPAESLALEIPPVFGKIGPAARSAIPALLRGAAYTNANVRWVAMAALGNMRLEPRVVVPVLTQGLRDPDTFVRANSARALAHYGNDAGEAIPALVEVLNDTNVWTRQAAMNALRDLHIRPEIAVPALVKSLDDTNGMNSFQAVLALEAYGGSAKPAVPALHEYLSGQTNPNMWATVSNNIGNILRASATNFPGGQ